MVRRLGRLLGSVWTLGLGVGALVIGWASRVGNFTSDELAPFVIEKLPLPHEDLWLAALKIHVLAAAFALLACLLGLSHGSACFAFAAHTAGWAGGGRSAVVPCCPGGPGALPARLYAKGGTPATAGFRASLG